MQVKPELKFIVSHKITKSTIAIYQSLKKNQFTTGHYAIPPRALSRFEAIDELNTKGDFLKCLINGELAAICFPRSISDSERELYGFPSDTNIYRPGSIFVKEKFRGLGIAQEMKQFLRDHYNASLFWVAREGNTSSENAATKSMRVHKRIYFDVEYKPTDDSESYLYSTTVYADLNT